MLVWNIKIKCKNLVPVFTCPIVSGPQYSHLWSREVVLDISKILSSFNSLSILLPPQSTSPPRHEPHLQFTLVFLL